MNPFTTAGLVRDQMARLGLSGAQLARRLGWTQSRLSRRLNGRARWSVSDVQDVARALDMSTTQLFLTGDVNR